MVEATTFDNSLFIGSSSCIRESTARSLISIPEQEEATCYLCCGDDSKERLVFSGCSCNVVAHTSCIAMAAARSVAITRDWLDCKNHWMKCPTCNKPHQNESTVELAMKLVDFVQHVYPGDNVITVNARVLLLRKISDMFMTTSQPCYSNGGISMANSILHMIGQIDISDEIKSRIIFAEAAVYNNLGDINLKNGTNSSIQQAVQHYEKCLELYKSVGTVASVGTDGDQVWVAINNGLNAAKHLLNGSSRLDDIMIGLDGLLINDLKEFKSKSIDKSIGNSNSAASDSSDCLETTIVKRRKRNADDESNVQDNAKEEPTQEIDNAKLDASDQEMRDAIDESNRDDAAAAPTQQIEEENQAQGMKVETTEYTMEINASGDSEPSDNCVLVRQSSRACQKDNPTDTSVISSKDDDAGRIESPGSGMLFDDQEVSLLRQTSRQRHAV